jgi:hypothetical protein
MEHFLLKIVAHEMGATDDEPFYFKGTFDVWATSSLATKI